MSRIIHRRLEYDSLDMLSSARAVISIRPILEKAMEKSSFEKIRVRMRRMLESCQSALAATTTMP